MPKKKAEEEQPDNLSMWDLIDPQTDEPEPDTTEPEHEQVEAGQAEVALKPGDDNYLARLLEAYRDGYEIFNQDNEVSADRVASEITGKYRSKDQCLKGKSGGVSYDGSLCADIKTALEAAERRGATGKKRGNQV